MSSLDDLRRTLQGHADLAVDPARDAGDAVARPAALHRRIARLRRRRRATVAGAIAAVVVAVAAIGVGSDVLHRGGHAPGPVKRPGHARIAVPDQVTADGFVYHLLERVTGSPGAGPIAKVDQGGRQIRAVVLSGSGLGHGTATLYSSLGPVDRLTGDGSTEPLLTDVRTLRVRYSRGTPRDASVTITVYQLEPGRPVFRDHAFGLKRLASGDDGGQPTSRVSVGFTSGVQAVYDSWYCIAPKGAGRVMTHVQIDDRAPVLAACLGVDADADVAVPPHTSVRLGAGSHTIRMWVSSAGATGSLRGVRFGVGAYVTEPTAVVAGFRAPREIAVGGRHWTLVPRVRTGQTVRPSAPMLAVELSRSGGFSSIRTSVPVVDLPDAAEVAGFSKDPVHVYGMLLPRSSYRIRLLATPPGGGAIVLYRLAD